MATTFSNKVAILNDIWENHRFDKNLADSVSEGNELTPEMEIAIESTFDNLLAELKVKDVGFEKFSEIISLA
jgi:hypothetical protein